MPLSTPAGLTSGSDTSGAAAASASISPTSGGVVYVAVSYAVNAGAAPDTGSVSGNSLTWTQVATQTHGTRRRTYVFRGTGTATAGSVTMSYDPLGATWQETKWSIFEITGQNTTTPNDAAQVASTAAATALACPGVGTPDAGDLIIGAFAIESDNVTPAADDGTTIHEVDEGASSQVRTLYTFYDADASDETPSITWSGTNSAAGIGFIVNVAAAGGANPAPSRLMTLGVG